MCTKTIFSGLVRLRTILLCVLCCVVGSRVAVRCDAQIAGVDDIRRATVAWKGPRGAGTSFTTLGGTYAFNRTPDGLWVSVVSQVTAGVTQWRGTITLTFISAGVYQCDIGVINVSGIAGETGDTLATTVYTQGNANSNGITWDAAGLTPGSQNVTSSLGRTESLPASAFGFQWFDFIPGVGSARTAPDDFPDESPGDGGLDRIKGAATQRADTINSLADEFNNPIAGADRSHFWTSMWWLQPEVEPIAGVSPAHLLNAANEGIDMVLGMVPSYLDVVAIRDFLKWVVAITFFMWCFWRITHYIQAMGAAQGSES